MPKMNPKKKYARENQMPNDLSKAIYLINLNEYRFKLRFSVFFFYDNVYAINLSVIRLKTTGPYMSNRSIIVSHSSERLINIDILQLELKFQTSINSS